MIQINLQTEEQRQQLLACINVACKAEPDTVRAVEALYPLVKAVREAKDVQTEQPTE